MRIVLIIMMCLIILSCSTMPDNYQMSDNEYIHLEYGVFWGIVMTGITSYTYYYLDEKAEWF